jgi:type II secretory pathway component PulC
VRKMNELGGAAALVVLALSPRGSAQPVERALQTSTLPLRLTGLMLDQNAPAKSACLVRCLAPPERTGLFFTGQTACDIAEIREIRSDSVVIENLLAHRIELLPFSPAGKAAESGQPAPEAAEPAPSEERERTPAVSPPASSDVVAIALTQSDIDGYLANLPDLLDSALTRPHFTETIGGQRLIDGYEIDNIREDSPVQHWGFQNGDIVLDVNGEPLDGMATVMRLFGRIQSASQTKVTVLRQGRKLTFVFTVK